MSRVTPSDSAPSTMCLFCKFLADKQSIKGVWVCSAFPSGIPDEISFAEFDHRHPHPEDNGFQFELVEGSVLPDWFEEIYLDSKDLHDDHF